MVRDVRQSAAMRMETLPMDECLRLLEQEHLGRIGFVVDGAPQVLPVNYRFHGGEVVIRTSYGRLVDHADHRPVAFEVDGGNGYEPGAWSVIVTGVAREETVPEALDDLRALPLRPWAPGEREHFLLVSPGAIDGRRIH